MRRAPVTLARRRSDRQRPGRYGRALGVLLATLAVMATSLPACTNGGGPPSGAPAGSTTESVTIASFDFPESEVLAEIYAQTLEASGIDVHRELDLGARELVMPALIRGLVDLVPEYSGSALEFLDGGSGLANSDEQRTTTLLRRWLARDDLTALESAPAQDQNAFAVTRATAQHLELQTISDLAGHAADFTIGGPPECPDRPLCLAGLRRTYGLRFGHFLPLDSGTAVAAALAQGTIDVGVLFSTDGTIARQHLAPLVDDLHLQPADNVTPVLRTETLDRIGTQARERLDEVSARLTTTDLRGLNARVAFAGAASSTVAHDWLVHNGLPAPSAAE